MRHAKRHFCLAAVAFSALVSPAFSASATDLGQPMAEGRLKRVLEAVDVDRDEVLVARQLPLSFEEIGIDVDPAAAADYLAGLVDEQIVSLIDSGEITADDQLSDAAFVIDINRSWTGPMGLDWLTIDSAAIVADFDPDDSFELSLVGYSTAGETPMTTVMSFDRDGNLNLSTSVDVFTIDQMGSLLECSGLAPPFDASELDSVIVFEGVVISAAWGDDAQFTISATTTLFNTVEADAMFSLVWPEDDGEPQVILGLRVHEWSLAAMHEGLYGTAAAEITFPEVAFTVAREVGTFSSDDLSSAARNFYAPVYGNDFTLELEAGFNFGGALPLKKLPRALVDAMGMDRRDSITVEGAIGLTFGMLSGGDMVDVSSFRFEAALPPAQNPVLPAALRSTHSVERVLRFSYDKSGFSLGIAQTLRVKIDGRVRAFELTTDIEKRGNDASARLAGRMLGSWEKPFGVEWLTLDDVSISTTITDDGVRTKFDASFDLAGKSMSVEIMVDNDRSKGNLVRIRGTVDELCWSELRDLIARQFPDARLFAGEPRFDASFEDIALTIEMGREKSFTISTTTEFRGVRTDVVITGKREATGNHLMAGFHFNEWELNRAIPALQGTLVGDLGLTLPSATIVVSNMDDNLDIDALPSDVERFYRLACGEQASRFEIHSGINLIGRTTLPQGEFSSIFDSIGVGGATDELLISGTLPGGIFCGDTSGLLSDLSLRIALPPMRPPFAPDWFISGQLALEVTGLPSVALVGEMTVEVKGLNEPVGDILTFYIKGNIARSGAGVAVALVGGLETAEPWVGPFGLDWLTFNDACIKVSIDVYGNLGLGFAGSIVIGEKDIDVAVYVQINLYSGVPTNFIFEGRSDAGVALSDLVILNNRMRQAVNPNAPEIPTNAIPDVAIRNLYLKFAPKTDLDLGVTAGFAIRGELLVRALPNAPMQTICMIDLCVDLNGIVAKGYIAGCQMGPVQWTNAHLSLTLTLQKQELIINGGAQVGAWSMYLNVHLTTEGIAKQIADEYGDELAAAAERAREAAEQARLAAERAAEQARQAAQQAAAALRARWAARHRWF